MAIVKKDPNAKTVGLAPKVAYPTVALVALGVVLCILDQTGVIDIDDTIWITLLAAGGGVAGVGAASPPALQMTK